MDIERFITIEDFLRLKPFADGGTLIDGKRYAMISKKFSAENQLKNLGKVDKTGEGVIDKVFFFEIFKDPVNENDDTNFQIVSAKVVDHYKRVSEQEAHKEIALIQAKIAIRKREISREEEENSNG